MMIMLIQMYQINYKKIFKKIKIIDFNFIASNLGVPQSSLDIRTKSELGFLIVLILFAFIRGLS